MTSEKVVQLVAVGDTPAALLQTLIEPLKTYLGVTAQLNKKSLAAPKYAFNKDRNQYHCNAIMKRLQPFLENPATDRVMGLLEVDLFVPDAPFVFGDADRESKVAVLSTFRLKGSEEQSRRRLIVEAVHQAGHLIGLSYCEDARCVMFLAQAPADCDRKNVSPCSLCRNELARLHR